MNTQTDTTIVPQNKCVVFDHDGTQLLKSAKAAGFQQIAVDLSDDVGAAKWLIEDETWKIAFVHIREQQWLSLVAKVAPNKILLRFSSEGFHPTPLENSKPLCLRYLRKTSQLRDTEEATDMKLLLDTLLQDDAVERLRMGVTVPTKLAGFISFRIPHRLRAIETTLGALLCAWASAADDAKSRNDARAALQIDAALPAPPKDFTHLRSVWRHLGISEKSEKCALDLAELREELSAELGVENFSSHPAIGSVLKKFMNTISEPNPDFEMDLADTISCFSAVRDYLKSL